MDYFEWESIKMVLMTFWTTIHYDRLTEWSQEQSIDLYALFTDISMSEIIVHVDIDL